MAGRQTAIGKALTLRGLRRSKGGVMVQLTSLKVSVEELSTNDGIERALAVVVAAALNGKIALEAATKLAYILDKLARAKLDRQRNAIIADLDRIPFAGLRLSGPTIIEQDATEGDEP